MDNNKMTTWHALVAGGGAGLSVDMILFPLDTIKTRLQSAQGFRHAGGFRGIYAGVGSAAAGSVPSASLFFMTYEMMKKALTPDSHNKKVLPFVHMAAASTGEVVACLIRVPTEVVKQRAQAGSHLSTRRVFLSTLKQDGVFGFYRGYWSTVAREVPFSLIQFPLWEYLKRIWSERQGHPVHPWQSSLTGAVAGGVAACVTTPLDVAKTRIILAKTGTIEAQGSILQVLAIVYNSKGIKGLFAGTLPRVMWISLGGAIFLGIYDNIKLILQKRERRERY